ncbi:50S ribosomal protein L21 [Dokdonella immobilis]|uniref:Large ribosomal subunit protein bL21 n=1 Tax=Dokdonella immobilis TaxID=578942 RepID=A0A1I4X2V7_9GAMM|nr:50S ribosomal protein L21 [Dokdonella immobilis]SFN20398.1 LSU ribosomal protein L21P [Dokdonella immobilis]
MYAVVLISGKQYRVAQGETLRVEKLVGDVDSTVDFDQVLMVGSGEGVSIGAPHVDGATVGAKIKSHGRADKIRIIKFRRRKHHMKQQGHRQHYTEIEITGINAGSAKKKATKE